MGKREIATMAKLNNMCEYCNIQLVLYRCWTIINNLPLVGTSEQNDALTLVSDALTLAHNLYDHDCARNVSNATLRRGGGDVS